MASRLGKDMIISLRCHLPDGKQALLVGRPVRFDIQFDEQRGRARAVNLSGPALVDMVPAPGTRPELMEGVVSKWIWQEPGHDPRAPSHSPTPQMPLWLWGAQSFGGPSQLLWSPQLLQQSGFMHNFERRQDTVSCSFSVGGKIDKAKRKTKQN
jgi:hypothetical protein